MIPSGKSHALLHLPEFLSLGDIVVCPLTEKLFPDSAGLLLTVFNGKKNNRG